MYRVIIADDEGIECRGLERMIQTFFPGTELLPSVSNGIDLIRSVSENKPDVAIVDINMPGLNGLEAVEILQMKSVETKVIINTAYNNAEYIKKALRLGASDYLQKPMEEQKFQEALGRVFQMIEQERRKRRLEADSSQELKRVRKVAEAEIMSSIFLGIPNEEEFAVLFENLNGDYFGGLMAAMVFEENEKRDVRLAAVQERMEAVLSRYCTCLMRRNKDFLYLLLIPGATVHANHYQEWTRELLEKAVREEAVCPCKFGVSSWKYEFEKMSEAYYECQIALRSQGNDRIRFFEEEGTEKERGILEKALEELRKLAGNGLWKEFEAELKKQISRCGTEKNGRKLLQTWMFRLILQCRQQMSPNDQEGLSESLFESRIWRAIGGCDSQDQFVAAALHFLREEKSDVKNEDIRNQYVQEALLYMEKNYMKDLSLEDTANAVGISSFYLSRLLKHQISRSFVEILTDIRVEHAIRLIMDEDFTVKDIGSRVGYPSRTYFYKVFKKNTGMTVGEMRELFRKV